MQNSMVMFALSALDQKYRIKANLVQIMKIVKLEIWYLD